MNLGARAAAILGVIVAVTLAFTSTGSAEDVLVDDTNPSDSPELTVGMRGSDPMIVEVDGQLYNVPWAVADDGDVLMQGDIFIGKFAEIEFAKPGDLQSLGDIGLQGLFVKGDYLWPLGKVSYVAEFDAGDERPALIKRAISGWERATGIRFYALDQPGGDYVAFVNAEPNRCSSAVGRQGGRQTIRIGANCKIGNIAHEVGHVLGLGHEHMRSDRPNFVRYFPQNVADGFADQFEPFPSHYDDIDDYCSGSLMHYGQYAFSREPGTLKTLEAIDGSDIGQRKFIKGCDAEVIDRMYADEFAKAR